MRDKTGHFPLFNTRIETIFKEQDQESITFCHHVTINNPEKEEDANGVSFEFEE
mgnify:CR=1 FL=1